MKWAHGIGCAVVSVALVVACGSSDDSGGGNSGKPSASAGCNAFCVAQSKLKCGAPLATCYDLCRANQPAKCQTEYEAAETCQSKNLSCTDPNTMQISGCTSEMVAYSNCATDGGVSDAGGD